MSSEGHPSNQDESPRDRGNLIVVSAPSGAGKSTLVERAVRMLDSIKYSVSYTTRRPRGKELEGEDYFFVTPEEFLAMRDRGEFLESAEVHGFLYGTHRGAVCRMLDEGNDVILDIDVQGAEQIRSQMPEAVTVFILPPSREVLESRLRLRNLNAPADLARRMRNAAEEVRLFDRFNYVIVNDDLERASNMLQGIITAERQRSDRQRRIARSIISTFGGETIHA